ncbi:MAG: histidine triad nucleotide-binding protein [Candidatus Omnitrophica bacterium]|nr:histidine triad nucleotide-binding protein [Candidatus Omnitrophota bacterium]
MSPQECLFCRIVNRSLPADIVGDAEGLLAIKDINPQAPTHLLILSTEHIPTLADATDTHTALLGNALHFANRLARQHQLVSSGYRLVINCGSGAGQSVWHLHLHLLGGRALRWPPG